MADENENESSVIKELRQQIKALSEENKTLKPLARDSVFKEAGVDMSDPRTKFFVEYYDGDLSAEAIREAAEPYGFVGQQQAAEEQAPSGPDEQQERMGALRNESTPEGAGKRLSHTEWSQLSQSDPQAAMEAHRNGLVDFPPEIAQNLEANRSAVRLGG